MNLPVDFVDLVAIHGYVSPDPTHLSFPTGARIEARAGQHGNVLWFGKFQHTSGWFPVSYCRLQQMRPHFSPVQTTKTTTAARRTKSYDEIRLWGDDDSTTAAANEKTTHTTTQGKKPRRAKSLDCEILNSPLVLEAISLHDASADPTSSSNTDSSNCSEGGDYDDNDDINTVELHLQQVKLSPSSKSKQHHTYRVQQRATPLLGRRHSHHNHCYNNNNQSNVSPIAAQKEIASQRVLRSSSSRRNSNTSSDGSKKRWFQKSAHSKKISPASKTSAPRRRSFRGAKTVPQQNHHIPEEQRQQQEAPPLKDVYILQEPEDPMDPIEIVAQAYLSRLKDRSLQGIFMSATTNGATATPTMAA